MAEIFAKPWRKSACKMDKEEYSEKKTKHAIFQHPVICALPKHLFANGKIMKVYFRVPFIKKKWIQMTLLPREVPRVEREVPRVEGGSSQGWTGSSQGWTGSSQGWTGIYIHLYLSLVVTPFYTPFCWATRRHLDLHKMLGKKETILPSLKLT